MTAGGAWFCVAWGVVATSMGLLAATDYRGSVETFLAEHAKHKAGLPLFGGRSPASGPAARVIVRVFGGILGCTGPVVLIVGVIALARRSSRIPAFDPHPHLNVVGIVGGCGILAGIVWLWRREDGLIRRGWDRGGSRRAAAVGMTVALLVALGGWASMILPLFVAGWVLLAPGVIILSLRPSGDPGHPDGG